MDNVHGDRNLVYTCVPLERHAEPALQTLVAPESISAALARTGDFLTQEVFRRHHPEHELLRYLRRLQEKDIALDRSMFPLGSCTMKLNATAEQ